MVYKMSELEVLVFWWYTACALYILLRSNIIIGGHGSRIRGAPGPNFMALSTLSKESKLKDSGHYL